MGRSPSIFKIHISHAQENDFQRLTEIAFSAKKFWGYPDCWIASWSEELTISRNYIQKNPVFKACEPSGTIVGFCALEHHAKEKEFEIAHAWIVPEYMGQGIGTLLLQKVLDIAEKKDNPRVIVIADPHARGFYEKKGFQFVKEIHGTPKGRMLPLLEKKY